MKILFFLTAISLGGFTQFGYSQETFLSSENHKTALKNIPIIWEFENKAKLDVNEIAFVNWNAGGASSISGLIALETILNYTKGHLKWKNKSVLRYGINKQEDTEGIRKTEDLIELNSSLGYRTSKTSNWFYSAKMDFRTQFADGYNYPDISQRISAFMAPGYLHLGSGIEYGKNMEKLSVYVSPLTVKATFVLDEMLSNQGAFGVRPAVLDDNGLIMEEGERVREEVGILFTNNYETDIVKNIKLTHALSFYTDYINNFGNVDVDFEMLLGFKVNNFVNASLGSHLKYDNDIKITEPSEDGSETEVVSGAKVQWKQMLGIGVEVVF